MESEKDFLANYKLSDYDRPSVTADVAAFMIRTADQTDCRNNPENRLTLLMIRRKRHPFKDMWALPGGFLERGETVGQCALREIQEETTVRPASVLPVGVFSQPDRDPRGWIISEAFASIISEASVRQTGCDDAADAQWFTVSFVCSEEGDYELTLSCAEHRLNAVLAADSERFGKTSFRIIESSGIAFDHAAIIAAALTALREEAGRRDAAFDFLPETYTLSELQRVQETLRNVSLLPSDAVPQ